MSQPTLERVPPHLRRYVVVQDYSEYTAADQMVWRFVLLQLYSRLKETAHPAYAEGLGRSGMSVERIPRVSEMDARLADVGWGAVCVDGFIPPRAFVEFQALGILPIAAEIRTRQHLAYTPAPDIIHEAAGHAPILPEPAYAEFLRNIGRVGARAFSTSSDAAAYDAIYRLSELKEDPSATAAEIQEAEAAVERTGAGVPEASEAARLARLYWWTVEYGLMGTPEDYRLYGAGLLSSLGESHFCHRPEVKKVPLSAACAGVTYDITRQQPQLFVARDFEHLGEVLEEVASTLSYRMGGEIALDRAAKSGEVATVELDSGLQLIGVLRSFEMHDSVTALQFEGPTAFAAGDRLLELDRQLGYLAVVGRLSDGTSVAGFERGSARPGESVTLSFADGTIITGRFGRLHRDGERALCLALEDAHLQRPDTEPHVLPNGRYIVPLAERVRTASAGAADANYWPATDFAATTVPKPRSYAPSEQRLLAIFARLNDARVEQRAEASLLQGIHRELAPFPDEWLLRWALLEQVTSIDRASPLAEALRQELATLEARFAGQQPIASGLRYLGETPSSSRRR